MIHAVLFDLDNTLLENDMARFIPSYLQALSTYMADLFSPERFVHCLLSATKAMTTNTDPSSTNREAFDALFFPCLKSTREELEPRFERFYVEHFPRLAHLTRARDAARSVMEWAFAQGVQVAIATNPLFPRLAIEHRLSWASVPVEEFPYHLVTSYENMHATKPHPDYYFEIAERLGRQPGACLLVGDDWAMDIRPAQSTGMMTYWIAGADSIHPSGERPADGQGSLADFARWIDRRVGQVTRG
ncbi:MAG: HAD family hydrolase [Anaerolineae bacterium]|nr:HAD family hydrolase [Anaerolineae bacterium]